MTAALLNHLWQSSAFLSIASIVAFALRRQSAAVRFWVWSAASLKFLVPFGALAGLFATHPDAPPFPALAVRAAQPFNIGAAAVNFSPLAAMPAPIAWHWSWLFAAIWLAGVVAVLALWTQRWWIVVQARRRGCSVPGDVPTIMTASSVEPGVFGIFHPVLLLPHNLAERLTSSQMEAVIAHEMCHVRRRDNLWSALHLLVEAVFWFFPPVWWLGARLIAERELACDEAVLTCGANAEEYAAGVLMVCRFYAAASTSSAACVAGVSGGDLTRRVRGIMDFAGSRRLGRAQQLALAGLLLAAASAPIVGRRLFAQKTTTAPALHFDAAAIHEWGSGHGPTGSFTVGVLSSPGRIYAQCADLNTFIHYAFHLMGSEPVEGMPDWAKASCGYPDSRGAFTLDATEPAGTSKDQSRQMMQSLLAERFNLATHWENRRMPIYTLVIAPGGFKLAPSDPAKDPPINPGSISCPTDDPHCNSGVCCGSMPVSAIAWSLTGTLGRPVIDKTGLQGDYFFDRLQWRGDDATSSPLPSLPALLRQYGLELKSETGPVPVLVITHLEKLHGQ